ncbi:MAG: RNA methyltransferase substrate-binding domain-containing protein, partial [Candidatus Thermoplasmatota archaeon]|nr:RNA methyltransferase substrate-binding domain-containing protein [Candidatus Thermoplasmatota archaeon]
MQGQGPEAAKAALASGQAKALLVLNERSPDLEALLNVARKQGVPVHEVTPRDLWRMAHPGEDALPEVLTLIGREPSAEDLQSM